MNCDLALNSLNWRYWTPKKKGLPRGLTLLGSIIVDPNVAKFAPWEKFDPRESRYALRYVSPKLCAEITKMWMKIKLKTFHFTMMNDLNDY